MSSDTVYIWGAKVPVMVGGCIFSYQNTLETALSWWGGVAVKDETAVVSASLTGKTSTCSVSTKERFRFSIFKLGMPITMAIEPVFKDNLNE